MTSNHEVAGSSPALGEGEKTTLALEAEGLREIERHNPPIKKTVSHSIKRD